MREAEIARYSLASGLHSLARANYADKGLFTHAFFNLATGLERMMKLVFLIDHALMNAGAFPTNDVMQNRFRHDLVKLYEAAKTTRARLLADGDDIHWTLPDEVLASRIIGVLGEFNSQTRYHNLDFLVGRTKLGRDPLEAWADDVARYLMSDYPARLRRRDEAWADEASQLLDGRIVMRHTSEDRRSIEDVSTAVLHGRRGEWVSEAGNVPRRHHRARSRRDTGCADVAGASRQSAERPWAR